MKICAVTSLAVSLSAPVPAWAQDVPAEGYLCCNMRTDGSWISDSNYVESGKRVIPYGTPVQFVGIGRYRVEITIDGESQWLGNDYSRDLDMETFARRYILDQDPRKVIAKAGPRVRKAVKKGKVTKGMTREQVAVALGYPISSETPDLEDTRWRYWLWSFSPYTVVFGQSGRVVRVEADTDTLHKVYMR
ncbi:hypothetical protein [Hydrogenophaga sp. 5NK40-0174]|uniref:hypothetical protein n=1 Tax=Hydrogenophaga sp. 5NK40-0174 TaxID=3127649 RepID=UPI00333FE0A9